MGNRILPSEVFGKEFMETLVEGNNPISCLVRQGARLMLQRALEEEVSHFLGRGHYQRRNGNPLTGYRNGYEPVKLNLGEGQIYIGDRHHIFYYIGDRHHIFKPAIFLGFRASFLLNTIAS